MMRVLRMICNAESQGYKQFMPAEFHCVAAKHIDHNGVELRDYLGLRARGVRAPLETAGISCCADFAAPGLRRSVARSPSTSSVFTTSSFSSQPRRAISTPYRMASRPRVV